LVINNREVANLQFAKRGERMKRHTNKDEFGNYIIGDLIDLGFQYGCKDLNLVTNVLNKLGKLEDIEEILGIDLIILFKALENGIFYYDKTYGEIRFATIGIRQKWENKEYELVSGSGYVYVNLTDYGKTWFLTKKEAEEKLKVLKQ